MKMLVSAAAVLAGAILLAPPAGAAADHTVEAACTYRFSTTTGNDVLVTVAAVAAVTGHAGAESTSVTCTVSNGLGQSVTATITLPGAVAAAANAGEIPNGTLTCGVTASAEWLDGHTDTDSEGCI